MKVVCDLDRKLCGVDCTGDPPTCRHNDEIAAEGITLSYKLNLSCSHRTVEWQGAVK